MCSSAGSSDKGLGSATTGYKCRVVAPDIVQALRLQWKPLNRCRARLWARRVWTCVKGLWKLELEFYPDGVVISPHSLMPTALMSHVAGLAL